MTKNIIFINGTMGVGKTSTSRELQKILPNCAFLDGDWCWNMDPFIVNAETTRMVEDNIQYILNNFLKCSVYENIIFCWVLHEQSIIESILNRLSLTDVNLYKFSLICSEPALTDRLLRDVERGIRTSDVIARSLSKSKNYVKMDTVKIDVSTIDVKQAAQEIKKYINNLT